jgi:diaminopimelate decarboxylase
VSLPQHAHEALVGLPAPRCAYVYDRTTLRATAASVRDALPKETVLLYAVKANGHPDVLAALATEVDGFEVASGGELALARIARAGAGRADQIVFGGPAKTDAELAAAVDVDATVNVESTHEMRRLAVAAESAGVRVQTVLRVNRKHVGLPGALRMTGTPTPFGLDPSQLDEAVRVASGHPALRVGGFSLHAVSNNLDAAAHAAFVLDAVDWAADAAAQYGIALATINVGGGFGVDYTGDDRFDLELFGTRLADGLRLPAESRIVFELGRYLTAEAGWYVAEVLDLKRNHGRWFAVLRGGTHHFRLPAAWGYSHPFTVLPVEEWAHPYDRPEVGGVEVDVVGELCTPKDVLTRGQHVSRLRVGDLLIFGRTGAYGWDISHHEFLRHDPPEFLITG